MESPSNTEPGGIEPTGSGPRGTRPSRTKRIVYGTIAGIGLFAGAAGVAAAATGQINPSPSAQEQGATNREHDEAPDATYKSSITVADNGPEKDDATEAAELAKLAKVSEADAKAAATAAVPGTVVDVELENEDGNVVWDVEVKGSDGKVTEVIVDAGNGKVLHQELEDSDDDDCNGKEAKGDKEVNETPDANTGSTAPTTAAGGN